MNGGDIGQVIKDLPDYRIVVKAKPGKTKMDKVIDFYIVYEEPHGDAKCKVRSFDVALFKANWLQEQISSQTAPQGFEKVPLISIGNLQLYRTVCKRNGVLAWDYVAETKEGEPIIHADDFQGLCINAVSHEVEVLNRAKREGAIR